jgi:hypothetical protein
VPCRLRCQVNHRASDLPGEALLAVSPLPAAYTCAVLLAKFSVVVNTTTVTPVIPARAPVSAGVVRYLAALGGAFSRFVFGPF